MKGIIGILPKSTKAINVDTELAAGFVLLFSSKSFSDSFERKLDVAIEKPSENRLASPSIIITPCDRPPPIAAVTIAKVVTIPSIAPYTN